MCESVTDWHTFGIIYLDLPMAKLENIRLTNQGVGIDRCKSAMFQAWINSKHDASWSDLITALSAHTCTVASDVNLPTTGILAIAVMFTLYEISCPELILVSQN